MGAGARGDPAVPSGRRSGLIQRAGTYNPSDLQAGPPGASISSTSTPWHERGWMKATGPSAPRRGAEGPVAFIHPRSCHGVLVELIEAPGGPAWGALGY